MEANANKYSCVWKNACLTNIEEVDGRSELYL